MLTDKIGDVLTRIRNGQRAKLTEIYVVKTKQIINLLNYFYNEGYIRGYSFLKEKPYLIKVLLKYDENMLPVIQKITRISKPSRRVYVTTKILIKFQKKYSNYVLLILSTNLGIMSHVKALTLNVGGEVICKIK